MGRPLGTEAATLLIFLLMASLIQISFDDIRAVTSYVFECSTSSLLLQTPSSLPDKAVGSSTDEDDCVEEKTE